MTENKNDPPFAQRIRNGHGSGPDSEDCPSEQFAYDSTSAIVSVSSLYVKEGCAVTSTSFDLRHIYVYG